jgi:hypothetical protein
MCVSRFVVDLGITKKHFGTIIIGILEGGMPAGRMPNIMLGRMLTII